MHMLDAPYIFIHVSGGLRYPSLLRVHMIPVRGLQTVLKQRFAGTDMVIQKHFITGVRFPDTSYSRLCGPWGYWAG